MNHFYLERPSMKREKEILDYIKELNNHNSDNNGIELLSNFKNKKDFKRCLLYCLNREDSSFSKKIGKAQVKTFLLIRGKDNRIIGAINIRWNHPTNTKYIGNIGYGIRPTERKKGYNKINLYLGLIEAKK